MALLVISVSSLAFVFVMILFYSTAVQSDHKKARLHTIGNAKQLILDEELEKPFLERVFKPLFASILKLLTKLIPHSKNGRLQNTEKNLSLAGLHIGANEYLAARIMLTVVLIIISVVVGVSISAGVQVVFLFVLFSIVLSLLFPVYFIKFRIRRRQEEILHQLPDVMDLLSVSIEAGLGFDAAMGKIGEKLKGLLVEEFNSALGEIQLGKPRREALKNMADRNPVDEFRTFIGSIIQAEQLGIPIKNVLNTQSQQMRVNRKQRAQEKAMKAPVKMLLPLLLFIFPVLFIVLLGPTVLQLLEQFG